MKKFLCIALLFCLVQVKAQLCFYPATSYSVGTNTNTKNITTGDFNGDGKMDIAMAIVTPSLVSILLGDGAGHFPTATTFTTNSQPYSICSADFNGDGNADIATANNGSTFKGFSVMLGNGAGSLGSVISYSAGTNPSGIATADFNADGKKDIAFTDFNALPTAAIPVYLGNGAGAFSLSATLSTGSGTVSAHPGAIVCADVTGDNKIDFLVACSDVTNKAFIFPGNGSGGATTPYAYTVGAGATYNTVNIAVSDFDGNGKKDIVTCNGASANVTVLLNNTAGTGVFTSNNYAAGNNANAVTCADFDADGDIDIAVCNSSNNQISILLNNGSGVFSPATATTAFGVDVNPVQMVTGDFNGDGKADIATANQNTSSDNISVLLNSLPNAISITGTTTICMGNSTTLTAVGTDAFVWSANAASATTNTVTVTPPANATYTVTGNNTGCTVTATQTVSVLVNNLPMVNITASPPYVCNTNPVTLTASGAATYTWSNGITNGTAFTPTGVATYTVNATDLNNCSNTATVTIGLSTPQVPQICLVTTDSATNYNYNTIYWDNTQYTNVDSFFIYRYEALGNLYLKIGQVSGDSSHWMDTVRHVYGGSNGGDPNFTSYKYTLAIKDSCGNVGQQSPRHETVFLQDQHNGNFNINPYFIGPGQSNPVTGYALFKDASGTGNNFTYLTIITGTSGTDPGYSTSAVYRVDILGFNCVANQRLANQGNNVNTIRQKSHSNTSRQAASGIAKNESNKVYIYPNPSNGVINIASTSNIDNIKISNMLGQVIYETKPNTENATLQLNNAGVYFVTITNGKEVSTKKVIVNK
ncbi:MAG TPA: FG-GAP-like repeat-containing protein [Bacteroidia bacterium]|nr:FG-GAP-like repeat-containing protein [Bacteroidia bacterium]